jgi:hypothetical protein
MDRDREGMGSMSVEGSGKIEVSYAALTTQWIAGFREYFSFL